jgi:exosome complex RNA-binding protein Rrp42 (RNase PH superfamily)
MDHHTPVEGKEAAPTTPDDERKEQQQQQQEGKDLTTWLNLIQIAIAPLDHPPTTMVDAYWKKGTRPDGRMLAEARQYTIQHGALPSSTEFHPSNSISNAVVGSALVRVTSSSAADIPSNSGDRSSSSISSGTVLLASVTVQVGQPSVSAPKQGDVVVSVASCSSVVASNNQCLQSLQSFLQRILEESLDLEQLIIMEGKAAYRLVVTISLIQDDSAASSVTLLDVCLAAAVAALLDTKLPVQPVVDEGLVYAYDSMYGVETKPLYMPIVPCSLTAIGARFCRYTEDGELGNTTNVVRAERHHWIVDPDIEEQQAQKSFVTVVVNAAASASVGTSWSGGTDTDHGSFSSEEQVLSIRFGPSACSTPNTHPIPSFTATANAITATELSQIVNMALGHAESLYSVLKPPSR